MELTRRIAETVGTAPAPSRATRSSLVARFGVGIGIVGATLALSFAIVSRPFIEDYEAGRQLAHVEDLLSAVENTARIACFTGDKTLAWEVASGLLANPAVAAVRITAHGESLVDAFPRGAVRGNDQSVRRSIASPFDNGAVVGELTVTADGDYILGQASRYSRFFTGLLLLQVAAVTLAVALAVLWLVVRPVRKLADGLRHIEGRLHEHLPLPSGHEDSEIGQLAGAFNRMIDSAARLLDRERALADGMARSEHRFRTLAENSPDIIARFSPAGVLTFANSACMRETGLIPASGSDAAPVRPNQWRPAMPLASFFERLAEVAATGLPENLYWEWDAGGCPVCHEIRMVAEYDTDGVLVGILAIGRNISARRQAERRLMHQATHDALTGLPNRALLGDRIEHAIAQAQRDNQMVAVIFADLDNFKDINDSLGHDVGDLLLQKLSWRMRHSLRESDTVARLGGDEFVAVLENATSSQDIEVIVHKLFESICRPCDVSGHRLFPGASLGVAVYPNDGKDTETLMRNADTAMYVAKERGRRHYRFFSEDMNDELNEWIDMTTSLRQALDDHEFELHYQPKVRLGDGAFVGMEALIRWRHPQRGNISPARFIPIAEKSGLIGAIGEWVLDEACRQARSWLDEGLDPGRVAVNLSASQCRGGLATQVIEALAAHSLPGRYLELEITESIVMDDAEESIRAFWALRDKEIEVAVDDFGTGYSSLSYLKRLPLDKLKIDKSFIDDIETDASDLEIVKAIIAMAHVLDLRVVAEGVEHAAQADILRAAGCDQIQGYLHCRPLPAAEMTRRLRTAAARNTRDIGETT